MRTLVMVTFSLLLALVCVAQERLGPAWKDPRNPVVRHFGGKRLDLWSLQALNPGKPPHRASHPIDAYLGTGSAQPAPTRVLARRLSFDLTGLPPTQADLIGFTGAPAYARKLLARRSYAEHQTRLWLDVVRYSDSNGFDWDEFRPLAWRFRDYVVRSFHADMPFDRFVTEQLAGDELVIGKPRTPTEQDALLATGFLRLGPWDNSAGLFGEADRVRHALMNDLVETTGAAFLGLTLACARCHDHKTEPLLQTDFYRFRAFFEGVTFRDDLSLALAPDQEPLKALIATDGDKAPAATYLLAGGDLHQPREELSYGFPSVLDPNVPRLAKPSREKSTGRRLTLARWIVSRENPLTARVFVNRVWQQHFGVGLVATPGDFGYSGARPSNLGLLDYLARYFQSSGYSVKKLHQHIVTSRAYQRHREPRRLSAEQLRDAVLQTSGKLTERSGGPPVWPPLPDEVLKANPAFLDDNKEKTKGWYPSPPERQNIRSLYLVQKRTVAVPWMATFDLPDNAVSCSRRTRSTVAPQALTLLNSPFMAEASAAFAERVIQSKSPDRLAVAFRLALQREPVPSERDLCQQLLDRHGLAALCRALLNLNEFVYIE